MCTYLPYDLEKIKRSVSLTQLLKKDVIKIKTRGDESFCCCPFHKEESASFHVYQAAQEIERFKCFGCGIGGSVIDYVMLRDTCDLPTACKTLGGVEQVSVERVERKESYSYQKPEPPNLMHPVLYNDICEGQVTLINDIEAQDRIAEARGWSREFVLWCAELCLIVLIKANGKRVIGFPVNSPSGDLYGIHIRWPDSDDGSPKWTFDPSGTPSYPFRTNCPPHLNKVIICEGQWDALSLAYAFKFHESHAVQDVCIIGVRGAQGIQPLLDYYKFPKDGKIVLCPDNDKAGDTWFKKDGFRDVLRDRVAQVIRWKIVGGKDVNDALRSGTLDHADMWKEINL